MRASGRAPFGAGVPEGQDPVGRRPPGVSAQDPHRPPRPARDDPQVRRPGPVLRDPGVRARHHGRRARVDGDRLRGRHQGGDAARSRPRRARRGGRRRRRDDRRSCVRGGPPGGRRGHADRGRAERQRDVDRAERRGAVAVFQPRAAEPEAVARARGLRGRADEAAGRNRRRVRAPRPARQGVAEGVLGTQPVVGGARLGLHGGDQRARRPGGPSRAARGAGG